MNTGNKKLCIAWVFGKQGAYELCVVHSRDITYEDLSTAGKVEQPSRCDFPIPVVFLDPELEKDGELCSFLAAKARRLLASPPFSDPATP